MVQKHFRQCHSSGLSNEYGPTEATVWATSKRLSKEDTFVSIGVPIPGSWAVVVDEKEKPCPPGVFGTLVLGGPNVAANYFDTGNSEASSFGCVAEHPDLQHLSGTHFFHSGDRAVVNDHRLQAGGFRLRLKAGSVRHSADWYQDLKCQCLMPFRRCEQAGPAPIPATSIPMYPPSAESHSLAHAG